MLGLGGYLIIVLVEEKNQTLCSVGTHSISTYKNDLKLALAINTVHEWTFRIKNKNKHNTVLPIENTI